MRFVTDVEAFAAERRDILERGDRALGPVVSMDLARLRRTPNAAWYSGIIDEMRPLWSGIYLDEHGDTPDERALAQRDEFLDQIVEALDLTTEPAATVADRRVQERRITRWLSTATVNSATVSAVDNSEVDGVPLLEWVTMMDSDVRESHREAAGQQRPVGETFDVGGFDLLYPGQPVGDPDVFLNCRCVLRPTIGGEEMSAPTTTFATDVEDEEILIEDEVDEEIDPDAPVTEDGLTDMVPFHGVLAPIGKMSGDRRRFKEGSITHRDGPAPVALRWVKADVGAHNGAVRVANFTNIWEEDGEVRAEGFMFDTPEAQEAIGILAQGAMGVSVDLDTVTADLMNEDGSDFDLELWQPGDPEPVMEVTEGRISAATLVDIPAFQEAYIALGPWESESLAASGCIACDEMDEAYEDMLSYAITDAEWDGAASRFTDEEWVRSTVVDRGEDFETAKERYAVPIKEPNGDLNRNAVHNAAARIDQVEGASEEAVDKGKRALVAAYRQLDEEPPESLVASALEAFAPGTKDGPGWITNPRETQRLRRYWTKGAGAAKIRWGQPGDFNRCRRQLAKYVKNPRFLAGTCANLHKVATGTWPGQHRSEPAEGAVMASAFTVVETEEHAVLLASGARPASWFQDPGLTENTPLTVTDDGRVFGHVATWDICHIGEPAGRGTCTLAPRSASDYAYFKTGLVRTDDGDIPVGHITLGTGHAGQRLNAARAAAHYDNTGSVVADVNVGEDRFGIWFSGALRPGLDDETVDVLRAAALSGDWRTIRGDYEMVAALACNVPGFPIPRTSLAASADGERSLVASGIVWARHEASQDPIDIDRIAEAVVGVMEKRQRLTSIRAALQPETYAYRAQRVRAARERIGK